MIEPSWQQGNRRGFERGSGYCWPRLLGGVWDVAYHSRTDGSTSQTFTWSTAGGLPLLLDDGLHSYVYGPSATLIEQIDDTSGVVQYLHTDLIGTLRAITNVTGTVTGTSTFDTNGNLTSHSGLADTAIGFTGNWTDPDTGLVYLRARDYHPITGQFLTVDPAVNTTHQPYAYAGNDPILFTDPTGLCVGIDGSPQDRQCTYNDYYWDGTLTALGDNAMAFWAGGSDGVGFNVPMLFDCTNYNKYKDNPVYWVGDVVGVLLAVGTLTAGADVRIGSAWASSTASEEAPVVATDTEATIGEAATPRLTSTPDFVNPANSPGNGWEWRGTGAMGSPRGSWFSPETGESLHPDLSHADPIGPHYDWITPDGASYRVYENGAVVPK